MFKFKSQNSIRKYAITSFLFVVIASIILLIFSQNNEEKVKKTNEEKTTLKKEIYVQKINPPLKKENVEFSHFKLNTKKGGEFHLKTGSHVFIAKNSIVDKNGNIVNGEVDIFFREFHDAKQIFLSGIPMQFNNSNNYLESIGMMELKGMKNNEELFLKPNSDSYIDLASKSKPQKEYALWSLDDNVEWIDAGEFKTISNNRREKALKLLQKEKNKRKKLSKSPNDFFEIYSDLNAFPHMEAWQGVSWELLKGKIPVDFERIDWNSIKMKNISKNIYKINMYKLMTSYDGDVVEKEVEMIATPVLSKKDLKRKKAEYATLNKKYKEFLKKAELEMNRLNQEAKLLNRFKLSGFGIYNVDVLKNTEVYAKLDLTFDFEKEYLKQANNVVLYMLLPEKNTVLNFRSDSWDDIPFTNSKTMLAAVLPGGDVAYVDQKEYNSKIKSKKINPGFQNSFSLSSKRISENEFSKLLNNSLN